MVAENLTQRTLALWEAELNERERSLRSAGITDKHTPTCECHEKLSCAEIIKELVAMKGAEQKVVGEWKGMLQVVMEEKAQLKVEWDAVRAREDKVRCREERLNRLEDEIRERESRLYNQARRAPPAAEKRKEQVKRMIKGNRKASTPPPVAPPMSPVSPKYQEGKTDDNPDFVESYIEYVTDSVESGATTPREKGGIITDEGDVVGLRRWQELYRASMCNDDTDDESPTLGRKESWKRKFSTVSVESALTDDELDDLYDQSEGLTLQEALIQYMITQDPSCFPPGIDPDYILELLMSNQY